jgi:predicted DNA-binding transcriptional regulator AlpA
MDRAQRTQRKASRTEHVPDDLWTAEQVASYFKVTPRTIREWREVDPTFPACLELPGRSVRWHRNDIIKWALSLRGEPA